MSAKIQITDQETRNIMNAAEADDIETIDEIARRVAKRNKTSRVEVLWAVKSSTSEHNVLHRTVRVFKTQTPVYLYNLEEQLFATQGWSNETLFSQRAKDGQNAAILASKFGSPKYVDFMEAAGSSVHAVDYAGHGALHYAAVYNNHKLVSHLMSKYGLAPDRPGSTGNTPLHVAALNDSLEAFKLLFSADQGCRVTPNADGITAVDMAFRYQSYKVMNYLQTELGMGNGGWVTSRQHYGSLDAMLDKWEKWRGEGFLPVTEFIYPWLKGVPDGLYTDDYSDEESCSEAGTEYYEGSDTETEESKRGRGCKRRRLR